MANDVSKNLNLNFKKQIEKLKDGYEKDRSGFH